MACEPLADSTISSPMLEPLNCSVSVPLPPSTTSLPSPGSQPNTSSPAPRFAVSLPTLPSTKSLPLPPSRMSLPSPPSRVSLPVPPSSVSWVSVAMPFWPTIVSLPAPPWISSCSTSVTDDGRRARREDRDARCRRSAMPMVSSPPVPLAVTVSVPAPPSITKRSPTPRFSTIDLRAQAVDHRRAGGKGQRIVVRGERHGDGVGRAVVAAVEAPTGPRAPD